ncbi:inner centromere protein A [Prorops nasuta]|uniref:inner centromere protein A n=1 Tax=Prorops nasuta TaxID=863751 RepID=UPI0034CDC1EB
MNKIKETILNDFLDCNKRYLDVERSILQDFEESLDFIDTLFNQIKRSNSGPLITKTPKVLRKKTFKEIETIPEDDILSNSNISIASQKKSINEDEEEKQQERQMPLSRSRRQASKKAADIIKVQQSLTLNTKIRRPSNDENDLNKIKKKKVSHPKRTKSSRSSSEEEEDIRPSKLIKVEEIRVKLERISSSGNLTICESNIQDKIEQERRSKTKSPRQSHLIESANKIVNLNNQTLTAQSEVEESSLYEDAIAKDLPIMNSTLKQTSIVVTEKPMMNVTVVIEPLKLPHFLNETVTLNKALTRSSGKKSNGSDDKLSSNGCSYRKSNSTSLINRNDKTFSIPVVTGCNSKNMQKAINDLITDDESSPELKRVKRKVNGANDRLYTSSDDELEFIPPKKLLKEAKQSPLKNVKNLKNNNVLFSPYAKESVKKRVEAFELASMNSPTINDSDVPTRMTRTKTKALLNQNAESNNIQDSGKSIAQQLARKSLAKAKKVSRARDTKESDEIKENNIYMTQNINNKAVLNGKAKQQLKATPINNTKLKLPVSVSRIQHTPNNQASYTKTLTVPRSNIATHIDSFLPSIKITNIDKDKLEDKRKKVVNDEDARRKKDEALRLITEEKKRKRQEKELKNKLAREAKEKLDMERRQKAEREREEKARLAQIMQEKQREEMEKKRLAQLQRAQEKEERRKHEEQLRLQRLQEQEEAERLLAEQRRREYEVERRKEAELRAQQQAVTEAMKKNQMIQSKAQDSKNAVNYILDSEPDEDGSDDESEPKYAIPHWAKPNVRKTQLEIQRFIPQNAVVAFFDSRKCTPDLTEIFQGIDRKKLKRTSSAIWKTPPRYSMMYSE